MGWMERIPDSRAFHDIVLPGSHDAGLYEVTERVGPCFNDNLVKTQTLSIKGQLEAGSRFFDLRVYNKKWKEGSFGSRETKSDLFLGHFAERDWRFIGIAARKGHHDIGGYGPKLQTVLDDIADFMATQDAASEAVILRFSHIKTKHASTVADAVKSTLGDYLYKRNGGSLYVSRFKMGETRRKVIVCVEAKNFADDIDPTKGIHAFHKYGSGDQGLATCGAYANKESIDKVIVDQRSRIQEHREHRGEDKEKNHLGMVYWQVTGGDIETNTKKEDGCMEHLGATLVQGLLSNNRSWLEGTGPGINIVGYDFVDGDHCKMIYDMNINFQFT